MSIPRRDPNFTMADLADVGDRFLKAGRDYWEAAHKAGVDGAVIWLTSTDGEMVIFTRGEYRLTLLSNIDRIGPARDFGFVADKAEEG